MVSKKAGPTIGVILAAGRGSRMDQLSTRLPKAVLPVLGEPIIYHQLRAMAKLGLEEAYIVVGYRGFEVVGEIERLPDLGLKIHYVEQEETLGIAHCVGRLEPLISGSFMLFLGDIYFDAPGLHEMLEVFSERGADAILGAIQEEDEAAIQKNFCIITDQEGWVTRVIEKPRHPKTKLKGVGLYLFTPPVFDAIRRTPRTAMRDEYEITDSIQIMIDDGYRVRASTCINADLNVTVAQDLLDVNLEVMRGRGLDRFLGESVFLGDGAVVDGSVVGAGAKIGAGARVKDSLVFSGASIPDGEQLERVIVTELRVHTV